MTQQIRRETHYVSLWLNNGLKHGEYRRVIGRDEDPEKADLYASDIQQETVEANNMSKLEGTLTLEKEKAKIKSQTAPGGAPRPKRPSR